MSPSNDTNAEEKVRAFISRLEDGENPSRFASELARAYCTNVECYDEDAILDSKVVEKLIAQAGGSTPRTRAHLLAVARQSIELELYYRSLSESSVAHVQSLLDYADDPDWRVRKTVLSPRVWSDVIEGLVENEEPWRDTGERFVTALVARLDDQNDLVRKQASDLLVGGHRGFGYVGTTYNEQKLDHAAELFCLHPDPGSAVPQLLAALENPVGSVGKTKHPAYTVGAILRALTDHEPDLLLAHEGKLRDLVLSEDKFVRLAVIDALVRVVPHTGDSLEQLVEGAMPLLQHEEEALQVRAAELIDRLDEAAPEGIASFESAWDEAAFTEACLATLDVGSSDFLETGFAVLEEWINRLENGNVDRILTGLHDTVTTTDDPGQYTDVLAVVFTYVRSNGSSSLTLEIIEAVVTEEPEETREIFEEHGGDSAFPPDVTSLLS